METLPQQIPYHRLDEPRINLQWPERIFSVLAGAKISLWGFKGFFRHPLNSLVKIGAGGYLLNRGITGHCDLYDMAGKTTTAPAVINVNTSVAVDRSPMDVYEFWRKLDNLPLFMNHLANVDVVNEVASRWTLKLPANVAEVSWDAAITNDMPGELISWESIQDSMVKTSGIVRFVEIAESGHTLVHVNINYEAPGGGIGAGVAQVLNPMFKTMLEDDILNFKRYMDISVSFVDDGEID